MVSPKLVTTIAAIGFVLSFLTGLVSGVSFGIVVLRAFLFAVVFAAIAFGADTVFKKFLADSSDSVQIAAEPTESPQTGSVVDITIGDEALPEEADAPDFFVSDELAGTVSKSRTAEKPVAEQRFPEQKRSAAEGVRTPERRTTDVNHNIGLAVPQNTASEKEQFRPVQLGAVAKSDMEVSDLDVLPDIGTLVIGETGGQSAIREDTDFAMGMSDTQSVSFSSPAANGVMDTETIAKAIRTALAKDS